MALCPEEPPKHSGRQTTGYSRLDLHGSPNTDPRPSAHRLLVEDALAANTADTPYYSRRPERLGRGLTRLFRILEETGILPGDLEEGNHRRAELRILYATYLERLRAGWIGNAEAPSTVDENIDHKK